MTTQSRTDAFVEQAGSPRRTRRWRAVGLDALTLLASVPAAYIWEWVDAGELPDIEQLSGGLMRTLPLCFLLAIARRFAHARRRGNTEQYDYVHMNPRGTFDVSDLLSAVPHVRWERHPGETAFFDNIIDRARFVDTPGLALRITYAGTPEEALEKLAPFRAAALHWDLETTTRGGYNVHAVFDIPPPSANQWTSDHGARMWISVNPGDTAGSSHVRAVFGAGGFGQGQPAAVIAAIAPVNWFPVEIASWALAVESQLRGAVSWWILVGRALGVDDEEFANLRGVNLTKDTAVGTVRSVANRETGKVLLWAIIGGVLLLFGLPILVAVIASF